MSNKYYLNVDNITADDKTPPFPPIKPRYNFEF